jgi:intracellular septation protein A
MILSLSGAVTLILTLIIGCTIFGLLALLINKNPWIPPDWKPSLLYVLLFIAVLVAIWILIGLANGGGGPIFRA